jgi:hypothetical protein
MVSMRHAGSPLLAGICIFNEPKKWRFGLHAQKLLQESALCGNFRQTPAKQTIDSRHGEPGAQMLRISPCSVTLSP